jgi:predicted PurR-regulated permease PerM
METSNSEPGKQAEKSPRWNLPTKLVFGLALVAIGIWLLVQFKNFLGPIIVSFLLTYIFHPAASFLQKKIKIPWRAAVTIIYVVAVIALLGLLTWGGLTLLDQVQNLIAFIEKNINQIPQLVTDLTQTTYNIGPFDFSLSGLDWSDLTDQIVGAIQPIIGQIGSIAGSVATGAANVILVIGIILLISYFMLVESKGVTNRLENIQIPGYTADMQRMGQELNNIWNAFIRGQLIVVLITIIVYTAYLGSMGIQFFFGLALVAALGRFIPYIGAWITWITYGLVALLQGTTIFNLPPGIYALILLGGAILIDTLLDNLLVPKVMSENLKVHPALVLVGALIAVDFLGVIGILLAAPVLATLKLFFGYLIDKLTDQDPWEELDNTPPVERAKWAIWLDELWAKISSWLVDISKKFGKWCRSTFTKANIKKVLPSKTKQKSEDKKTSKK